MALAGETPVPTLEGWMLINKIRPGQTVFDQSGRQNTVVAVCHREPEPVFRVAFDDESYLTAGADQPWVTATHPLRHRAHTGGFRIENLAWDFLPPTTEQIQSSLIHRRGSLIEAMHSVPVAGPLILPGRELPIDPYLLGLWLGDGTSGSAHHHLPRGRRTCLAETCHRCRGELAHHGRQERRALLQPGARSTAAVSDQASPAGGPQQQARSTHVSSRQHRPEAGAPEGPDGFGWLR